MAKPIEPTPVLSGSEAEKFLERMAKKERSKMTKKEMKIFRDIFFMDDGKTPRCHYCGKAMKNYVAKKGKFKGVQKYSWVCDCPSFPKNIIISVG